MRPQGNVEHLAAMQLDLFSLKLCSTSSHVLENHRLHPKGDVTSTQRKLSTQSDVHLHNYNLEPAGEMPLTGFHKPQGNCSLKARPLNLGNVFGKSPLNIFQQLAPSIYSGENQNASSGNFESKTTRPHVV